MTTVGVLGLGSFGMALARALTRLGAQVTAIDNDIAHVEAVKDDVHTAIRLDARDRNALSEQGIHRVDIAVVCMGEDFEAAEIAAVHLRELECPKVVVRGTSRERVDILNALGPEVITPGIDAARTLAVRILAEGVTDYQSFPGEHDVALITVPEHAEGLTLGEFPGPGNYGRALALRRGEGATAELFLAPGETTKIRVGDHLFYLGTERELIRLGERVGRSG